MGRRLFPQTLKYRLFVSFLLLILIPFTFLSVRNLQDTQQFLQEQIRQQDAQTMQAFRSSLEDVMGIASKAVLLLEQDQAVVDVLLRPDRYTFLERQGLIERRILGISNSFLLSSPPVYFTVLDRVGHVYSTFIPREPFNHTNLLNEPWAAELLASSAPNYWSATAENYLPIETSRSSTLITLYGKIRDNELQTAGLYRASVDTLSWFTTMSRQMAMPEASFYLVDGGGRVLAATPDAPSLHPPPLHTPSLNTALLNIPQSGAASVSPTSATPAASPLVELEGGTQLPITANPSALLSTSYLPALDLYIIKSVPRDVLFRQLNEDQRNFIVGFLLFTLLFVSITFFLSSTMTRPLQLLERKMSLAASSELKVSLSEHTFQGELKSLAGSFNRMIQDIEHLLQRLKREAKEREAVRFQVLLSQMNPHFLLNTLNTIKSISVRNQAMDIHQICISLGKVLEVSLNTELDLIHLKKEIEVVQAYMVVQAYRFEHQIEIRYEYDEELAYALVPKFFLQPLIENALLHGFNQMTLPGEIAVRAYREGNRLFVDVTDNGVGWEAAQRNKPKRKRTGISHQNIRERLQLIFKEEGELIIVPREQGVIVRLSFPLLVATPHEREEE